MASVSPASSLDRRPSATSTIRPSLRHSKPPLPSSPHTPQQQRQVLSSYTPASSPGSSFRHEEDSVILELGSRWLLAGFEGDSAPMCVVGFGPQESKRVGDYRAWLKSNSQQDTGRGKITKNLNSWSRNYELWNMDIRDLDIGLVEDKIERAIREVYNKYLLTDAGSSRLILVLPSIVPYPLLSSILTTIFNRWRHPSVTLLPSATMAAVGAGIRSALVVDIGWAETTVTGVYEYREIQSKRSTRATKLLLQEMGKLLTRLLVQDGGPQDEQAQEHESLSVSLESCEEIMTRLAWCQHRWEDGRLLSGPANDKTLTPIAKGFEDSEEKEFGFSDANVSLPLPFATGSAYRDVAFSKFSEPVEEAFFAGGVAPRDLDDEEMPLGVLVYNALLALPPDVRGTCMSRVVFIGGGSNIPGVRQRILNEVESLIQKFKWSLVRGRAIDERNKQLQGLNISRQQPRRGSSPATEDKTNQSSDHALDFVEEKLRRSNKVSKPYVHGVLRQIETLGPWAGASLVTSLKVRGMVEIEREKFLQHGMSGASRESEINVISERRSGFGLASRSGGERSGWTLGEWA